MSNVIRRKAFLIRIPKRGVEYEYFTSEKSPTVQELLQYYYRDGLYFLLPFYYGREISIYIIAHPLIYVKPEY